MSTRGNVLVVDDESLIRWSIVQSVQKRGFSGIEASDGREALERAGDADAVILDYRLPDCSGFDLLRDLRRTKPTLPVIMLTAHSSVEHAVQAMKLGAFHYVAKPFDLEHMLGLVEDAISGGARRAPIARLTSATIAGESMLIQEVRRAIARAAASTTSVLITGESGTGKDLTARAIHGESRRATGPFVAMGCADIHPSLLEAELFGHEPGATPQARVQRPGMIELAAGGTLFLDDVGALPSALQAKLLELLDTGTFRRVGGTEELKADARVVAATKVELSDAAREGAFRIDLYDQLAMTHIRLPALRERRDDIPLLAQRFLEQLNAEHDRSARFGPGAIDALRQQRWPGNVRELRDTLERAVLLHGDELGPSAFEASPSEGEVRLPSAGLDMEVLERELLLQALERAGGNQRVAGTMLGMNRDQVRYRMAKYGIPSRRRRTET